MTWDRHSNYKTFTETSYSEIFCIISSRQNSGSETMSLSWLQCYHVINETTLNFTISRKRVEKKICLEWFIISDYDPEILISEDHIVRKGFRQSLFSNYYWKNISFCFNCSPFFQIAMSCENHLKLTIMTYLHYFMRMTESFNSHSSWSLYTHLWFRYHTFDSTIWFLKSLWFNRVWNFDIIVFFWMTWSRYSLLVLDRSWRGCLRFD